MKGGSLEEAVLLLAEVDDTRSLVLVLLNPTAVVEVHVDGGLAVFLARDENSRPLVPVAGDKDSRSLVPVPVPSMLNPTAVVDVEVRAEAEIFAVLHRRSLILVLLNPTAVLGVHVDGCLALFLARDNNSRFRVVVPNPQVLILVSALAVEANRWRRRERGAGGSLRRCVVVYWC